MVVTSFRERSAVIRRKAGLNGFLPAWFFQRAPHDLVEGEGHFSPLMFFLLSGLREFFEW